MKYEFNFTWNDVLRDAGLDVSEEKITSSLFQKANKPYITVPAFEFDLNSKVNVFDFVEFLHYVLNKHTASIQEIVREYNPNYEFEYNENGNLVLNDDIISIVITSLFRPDVNMDIEDGNIDIENYSVKRFLSNLINENLLVAFRTEDTLSAYKYNINNFSWAMVPVTNLMMNLLK